MRVKPIMMLCMALILLAGCAGSASMLNNLSVGMSKAQVLDILGAPDYTSARQGTEILCYRLTSDGFFRDSFYVIIKQGTVERYGRQGDFGIYY